MTARDPLPVVLRGLGRLLAVVALGLLDLALRLILLVLVALELPGAGTLLARQLNGVLEGQFRGQLLIEELHDVGLEGVEGGSLRLLSEDGRELARAQGVDVRISFLDLARSALFGDGPLEVAIERIEIDHASVLLSEDRAGNLELGEALSPREPPKPGKGRATVIRIDELELDHAWVHGELGRAPVDVEIHELELGLISNPTGLTVSPARARLEARALPGGNTAELRVAADVLVPSGGLPRGRVEAGGTLAGALVRARLSSAGESAAIDASIAGVQPSIVRSVVPGLELGAPAAARLRAGGSLARMGFELEAAVGSARADLRGTVSTRPDLEATLRLETANLDTRLFSSSAPALRADAAEGTLWAEMTGGSLRSKLELDVRALSAGSTELPDVDLAADLQRDTGATRVHALLSLPSSPRSLAELEVLQAEPGAAVDASLSARVVADSLGRVRGAPRGLSGELELAANARLDLSERTMTADASARLVRARVSDLVVRQARVAASVRGALADPALELRVQVDGARSGRWKLASARVDASGRLSALDVAARATDPIGRRATLHTRLDVQRERLERPTITVRSNGVTLSARAERVALRGSEVVLDAGVVDGAGRVLIDGRVGGRRTELRALGTEVDLARIARFASLDEQPRGELGFEAAVEIVHDRISGRVRARLRDGALGRAEGISARLVAALREGRLDLEAEANWGRAGNLYLSASELSAPRRSDLLDTARAATGEVFAEARLDLAELPREVTRRLRIDQAQGRLELAASGRRAPGENAPDVSARLAARGVAFTYRPRAAGASDRARKANVVHVQPLHVGASVDFDPREPRAHAELHASDGTGRLVEAEARAPLTLFDLIGPALERKLTQPVPIAARLVVPQRDLGQLPEILRPAGVEAKLRVDALITGTLRDPVAWVEVLGREIRVGPSTLRQPIGAHLLLRHERSTTQAVLTADRGGRELLDAHAVARGSVKELASGRGVLSSVRARIHAFPLSTLPGAGERQVTGHASGVLVVEELGRRGSLEAHVSVPDLRLGTVGCRTAEARLSIGADGKLAARLTIEHAGGYARARVASRVRWGAALAPQIEKNAPFEAELDAENMSLAAFHPFVRESLGELEGSLDADLRIKGDGGVHLVSGNARLRDGLVHVPAIGQQYRDIRARLEVTREGTIEVHDLSALGLTGRLRAAAAIHLEGLSVSHIRGRAVVDEGEKIPIALQGVSMGHLWGAVDATYTHSSSPERPSILDVEVGKLHVLLSEKDSRNLQSLEPASRIRVGVRDRQQDFHPLPLGAPEDDGDDAGPSLMVELKLGPEVWIHRGRGVEIRLDGRLTMDVGAETRARGQIRVKGGQVDVRGKIFEVEQGIITYAGYELSNPMVVATARWESPDGYTVYAQYRGRAQDGKLSLRADPALTQDQILSLLLFGSPEGSFASGEGEGDGTAAAMTAAGVATKGLNSAIDDLTELDVTTRIDTSHGSARPEVVWQITPRLSAELAYAPGDPAPGRPQDDTFLTLELRLGSSVSLEATAGDKGATMLDMVWQQRY